MRFRNGSALVVLLWLAALFSLSRYGAWVKERGNEVDIYQKQFLDLHQRLLVAKNENKRRSHELSAVLNELKHVVVERRNTTQNYTEEDVKWKPLNLSSRLSLPLLNLYFYLPHLLEQEDSLQPNIIFTQGRTGVSLVMGIPTVKRSKESYLMGTLNSLFYEMSAEEKNDCLVIVFVAEINVQFVNAIAETIIHAFPHEVQSGMIEVISPPPAYYPDFSNIKETFGDSKERVRWRTKQNLDYSFLMLYAQPKGTFYIQLEDDIIAKPGYFQSIKDVAVQQTSDDWLILEFSQLGFIGKLFKAKDVPLIAEFFLMFYKDKPIDWLLDHLLWVKVCNPEKDAKHCSRQKDNLRIRYRPSLFQHVGTHSSLEGKIQNLKDKDFGKQVLHKSHLNPPATVTTSLKVYQQYTLEKAYKGMDCFWALSPVAGDYILFSFTKPLQIEGYLFRSGNVEHPGDKIINTSVEVLLAEKANLPKDFLGNRSTSSNQTEDGYLKIGMFVNGVAEGIIPPSLGKILAIRLSILSESQVWALLSEIYIRIRK
ncbi:alpha-1,3-mannosyl-glycoprotein 4-beta-N-acetylglucosaminyltransferase B [Microcaecilia unicolor]|uniref:Alpha-1,3-mannosyl-glycoprotein 4-beta-N-acetylglucosaminyltransferase B-like n=1 Tax=Microcaecilia unicolor TaxID=1415580 RepID=A0A6P7WPY4_9AMPH|nr:alpha-1,3-mannosyl-glycoprotein 4-beta-N-acetylglucosaminyltransferase B-like [Microcaecilia unicolor]